MLERPTSKAGWTRVAFGEVVRLSKARVAEPEAAGIERVVGLEHIEPGDLRIRRWGDVTDGTTFTTLFKPGQVLFGKRRAYQRKVAVADFEGVCSGDIYVLEPANDWLMPELLPFLCQTDAFFDHAVGTSAGSLSPRTNWTSLASFEFLLPPIREQSRLVEALSAADKLAGVQHDLLTRSESVFKALFKERIGRGFKPADYQRWEEDDEPNMCFVRLSDVASVDRGRFSHRPRNLPQFFGGPYPFAQTGDVAAARGRDFSASQFLSDEGVQYGKSFPPGTIFLTIAAVIAATAISTTETYCTDSVVGIVPKDPLDVDYLEYTLRFTRPYLEFEVATQTAQKNINLEVLRPLTIPWPSKEDRDAIAKELAAAESAIRTIEARQAATKKIMHEILRANFEVPA
ncbi:MAG: restriction endonuclease subunit S [Nitrobacter sp.]|uniref:restriction endonuclease subunit S n=1 Tax=Nitrobacter sp. TaxID=29420 RepID=UPI0026289C7D|nr:restriction endonuclease subunit S [Nitrobacter sp.]MCV0388033.1 restriction endonuclease subunit S [Nitrobacter sp.]